MFVWWLVGTTKLYLRNRPIQHLIYALVFASPSGFLCAYHQLVNVYFFDHATANSDVGFVFLIETVAKTGVMESDSFQTRFPFLPTLTLSIEEFTNYGFDSISAGKIYSLRAMLI